jgi:hypothetical protein
MFHLLVAICFLPVIGPIYTISIQLFMFQLTWTMCSLYSGEPLTQHTFMSFSCVCMVLYRYPSDADKHLLARHTGLSRNQVCL